MPVITIQTHELDKATKKDLIGKLSAVAAETIRVPEGYFTVFVDEFADDSIGCGGKTREALKAGA